MSNELSNNIQGNHSRDDLKQITLAIQEEAVKWKRNSFILPAGKEGKDYTMEL